MVDRFRTPRKEKIWSAIPSFIQAMTGDGTFVIAGVPFNGPQTVMRMLGEYVISPNGATVAQDMVKITVGIGKVSGDAFTLGSTAMPDPAGESNYPWLYWAEHPFFFASTSADPIMEVSSVRVPFDIRSMRKFRAGQQLAFVFQYADLNGAPPMRIVAGQTRILLTTN